MKCEPYYEVTKEREYIIINDQPVDTIHLELGQPRTRITLNKKKWIVSSHMADSGSIQSVLISPKKKKREG